MCRSLFYGRGAVGRASGMKSQGWGGGWPCANRAIAPRRAVGRRRHPLTPTKAEGRTVTIVDAARPVTGSGNTHPDLHAAPCLVTGGVDTHLDLNVAAALDPVGGLLAVAEFPTTSAGHRDLLGWLSGFGPVAPVGVEGTGSYGAGLARFLQAAGVQVVEVDRPNRQARRRSGKSDPLDAVEAARAALSGRASGAAKSRDGNVEAIRALVVAKRSARSAKIPALNQNRHPSLTAPPHLRQHPAGVSRH